MSTTTDTMLLTNSVAATQAAQPVKRIEPQAASSPAVVSPGASDSVEEGLSNQLDKSWSDFMARAEGDVGLAPAQSDAPTVQKATSASDVNDASVAKKAEKLDTSKVVVLPAPPQEEAPPPPPPAKKETAPPPETPAAPAAAERPRVKTSGGEARQPTGPEGDRQEVARDRSQLASRVAETDQLAREVSARERLVDQARGLASAKRSEAFRLRGRLAEHQAALGQLDLEMEDLTAQPEAFLERFEEVERMQMLRYHMQAEIQQDEHACREAEAEAAHYTQLADEHEQSLQRGRLEVEHRRTEIDADRETIERKATDAERRSGLMDASVATGSLQFWSDLARSGEVELASFEARREQDRMDARNAQTRTRLDLTLNTVRNGNVGGGLELDALQRRLESLSP